MQSQGINVPAAQQLRFAKAKPAVAKAAPKKPVEGLLKDPNMRMARRPWTPSFGVAVRLIILVRFLAGMYSSISDCDEVFNYWEPLHYLAKGKGFQTWEYSPEYAIRSYFYLAINSLPGWAARFFLDKRPAFFALRLTFATISSLVEATLYRAAVDHLSIHVGRYLLVSMLGSAALFSASTAFLPSTFAMWGVMLGTAAALAPVDGGWKRITTATLGFAAAAVVGWPFAALLGVPLVLEQLFVRGSEKVVKGQSALWAATRARNMAIAMLAGLTLFVPVILVDSRAYGRLEIVPLNIIKYNIFSTSGGPELYGTEPWSFYIFNGLLGFNILLPLALYSIPTLFVTAVYDPKRVGDQRDRIPGQTSPFVSLAIRLSPLYLWLGVLTLQPHKEERFLFPAYGLVLLNASTTIYLLRGWFEQAFISYTKSPYKATKTSLFSNFTRTVLATTTLLSLFRILSLFTYYHAPLTVYQHFQSFELPRLALSKFPALYPAIDPTLPLKEFATALDSAERRIDLAPLAKLNLRLCVGKEWHRFPSHYLVPDEVEVRFIKSDFDGILPKVWETPEGSTGLWGRATNVVPSGMNDLNKEELDRYVDVSTCDYLVDLDFPLRTRPTSPLEPRYAVDSKHWERVYCLPFLDNEHSARLTRTILVPVPTWQSYNQYGDYCLLKQKGKL